MMPRLSAIQGDITKLAVDAIVNAANTSLLGGGGVDGAIHRAGGPEILAACRAIRARQGGCKVGEAVATPAGRLPCRYVIHTVGPVYQVDEHEECCRLLASCYLRSLEAAADLGCQSVAFTAISTGIYGFPKRHAAEVAVETVRASQTSVKEVQFICFDEETFRLYVEILDTTAKSQLTLE